MADIQKAQQENKAADVQQHQSTLKAFLITFNAAIGAFFFGYSISVFSLAKNTIFAVFEVDGDFAKTAESLSTATIPFGAMIGSSGAAILLQYISRKHALILTDIIGIIGTLFSQIPNIWVFFISRLISGIATGLNSSVVPLYIQEVSPIKLRGVMGMTFGFSINIGIIIGAFLGIFFEQIPNPNDTYWRFVFLFPLLLSVPRVIFIMLFCNYETPLFYYLKGQEGACDQMLKQIYKEEFVAEAKAEIKESAQKIQSTKMSMADMFGPRFLKVVIIGCLLQIFQQWSGINAVIMYSGNIFEKSISDFNLKNIINLVSFIVLFLAAVFSSFFINCLGRKTILMYGALLCCIFQAILTIVSAVDKPGLEGLSVTLIYLYYLAFNFSLGPVVWLYNAEVLPEKGVAIATFSNWLSGFILTLVVPYIEGIYYLFGFYSIVCLLCFLFVMMIVKETKGKTKNQIDAFYQPASLSKAYELNSPAVGTNANLQNPQNNH